MRPCFFLKRARPRAPGQNFALQTNEAGVRARGQGVEIFAQRLFCWGQGEEILECSVVIQISSSPGGDSYRTRQNSRHAPRIPRRGASNSTSCYVRHSWFMWVKSQAFNISEFLFRTYYRDRNWCLVSWDMRKQKYAQCKRKFCCWKGNSLV